ncbi:MAG: SBBP repeat-containing protein [Bacteroidota bacterium]
MKTHQVCSPQSAVRSPQSAVRNSRLSFLIVFLILLLPSSYLFSQIDSTFEDIQRAMNEQFQAFVAQNEQEFNQYAEEIDREFASYLKQAWEEFALFAAVKPDTTPKPKELPRFEPLTQTLTPRELLLEPAVGTPVEIPPVPNVPVVLKTEMEDRDIESATIDFYGTTLNFDYDPGLVIDFPTPFTNQQIGDFWETASLTDYAPLVNQLTGAKSQMNLNDWGYYLLVNQFAGKISNSTNTSRLVAWYLLTKSGYKIRVAYAENKIYLLFPAANMIYGIKYFLIDYIKYYAPDFPFDKVATYEKDFPEATRILDLNIYNALNIGTDHADRPFRLTYENKECSFTVKYNLNAIEFYKDYPLCELRVYFDAAVSPEMKESLLLALQPHLENRSESSAVNFLLNFVQNGFKYKTDPEQFHGMEKFFFPEEDFYYPYSDCDDRAVLFAYLVRELLELKVVGVEYPGHVATAVHFTTEVPGDYIVWKNEKYVIADPTYINAPVGMTMPGMINEKARVIELVNGQNTSLQYADIWKQAEACGGKPGDNQQTIVTDSDGNSYVTGYFSGTAQFGNTTLTSVRGQNDVFIAAFNKAGMPLWAAQAGGDRNDLGYNIAMDRNGNLYITGSFHGTIKFGNRSLRAPVYTDLFMAKYTPDGKLLWVNQAGLDTTSETSDYIFVTSFTPGGKHLDTRLYAEDENFKDYGISFDPEGNAYYTASYTSTVGLNIDMIWLDLVTDFNVTSTLKEENDKQLSVNTEKTIAGLFAAISLIRVNNVAISGKAVQDAFSKYNPGFKQVAPKVFNCIGKVQVMKNNEGIVTVTTEDQDPVVLDKIKIYHDARLKVTMLPSGDAKMEILGGVKVGKAFIWFPLNYVRLFRTNGNVLFDYDDDHSQVTLNMKKDMLF